MSQLTVFPHLKALTQPDRNSFLQCAIVDSAHTSGDIKVQSNSESLFEASYVNAIRVAKAYACMDKSGYIFLGVKCKVVKCSWGLLYCVPVHGGYMLVADTNSELSRTQLRNFGKHHDLSVFKRSAWVAIPQFSFTSCQGIERAMIRTTGTFYDYPIKMHSEISFNTEYVYAGIVPKFNYLNKQLTVAFMRENTLEFVAIVTKPSWEVLNL